MRTVAVIATLACSVGSVLSGQTKAVASQAKLGTVRFATTCAPAVQAGFNRAVAQLHSFAFGASTQSFDEVLRMDPDCAIAYWGLALGDWGNPFAPGIKPNAIIEHGREHVEHGRVTGHPSDREHSFLEAVAHLYQDAELSQPERLARYRSAMAEVAAQYPTDTEAVIFAALASVIAADPADKTYASQLAAGATLERLFKALPDHPGLAHYIIHTYDVPALAARSVVAARRYSQIAPGTSHALHMPSHTFTRIGAWQQSIQVNGSSVQAARAEGSTAEELHASDYLAYAYLQLGRDKAAKAIVDALPEIVGRFDPDVVGTGAPPAAGFYAAAAIPARYALERGAWGEAAALVVGQSPVPFANAVTYFARALGASRLGDTTAASEAIGSLERIRAQLAQRKEAYWSDQVEIQRLSATAWLELARGAKDQALATMQSAAEREDSTEKSVLTPGPLAPARELLGDMLLATSQPQRALAEYERTLKVEPGRFRAIAGAARAATEAGNTTVARGYLAQLLKLAERADQPLRPEIVEAVRALRTSR